ncbi:mRpS29 [Trypoxylus dichotomus]
MFKILRNDVFAPRIIYNTSRKALTTAADPQSKPESFRTSEDNPLNHSLNHEARFYRLPPPVKNQLFQYGGLPKTFEIQIKTFAESCIMVRKSTLNIIECLNAIDYSKPVVRFVLYGNKGSGKSLTLAHILHYGHANKFLLVHVPWVGSWMRRCKEYSNSTTKEGFVDLNLDAVAWLAQFKHQNLELLNNPEFIISNEYAWSKREITPKGSKLLDLVEHGINRVKYASDCVVAVAQEIKLLSSSAKCKTLVAIDGYNAFFYPNTRVYTDKKEMVHPHKVTLTTAFLALTEYNWTNAVCVLTVDEIAIAEKDQISHFPKYLLGKEGFEHLDPFIPIHVPNYTSKEFTSCMEYYKDRKWVQDFPGINEELRFLSNANPYKLMQMCGPL